MTWSAFTEQWMEEIAVAIRSCGKKENTLVAACGEMEKGKTYQLYGSRSERICWEDASPLRRNRCWEGSDYNTATTSAEGFATEAEYLGRYSICFEASGRCFAKSTCSRMNALIVQLADVNKQIKISRQDVMEFRLRGNQLESLDANTIISYRRRMHSKENYSLYEANYTISEIGFSHGLMSIFTATRRAAIYI